jgi:hypothetical protein
MTPVKKVLHDQEQDEQRQLEFNSQEQITQLKADFKISKVNYKYLIKMISYLKYFSIRLIFYLNGHY